MSSQIIEMSELKQDNPPCCICYVQKATKNIIEYRCSQCQEGVVCLDCAAKLWKTNSKDKCPICNFSPQAPDTWYKSYDVEMGYIYPPSIIDTTTGIDDDDEENPNRGLLCNKQNSLLASFIILFAIFIAFIVGTVIKTLEGYCAWNCPHEDLAFTIVGSIGIGIIGIPVIALCLLFAMFIIGVIYEGIKYCTMKIYNGLNHYEVNYGATLRQACAKLLTKKIKACGLFVCFIIGSFSAGTLFKLFTGMCALNCKDETEFYTLFTSTLVGIPVLIISVLFIMIVFSCSALCFITCKNRVSNNYR